MRPELDLHRVRLMTTVTVMIQTHQNETWLRSSNRLLLSAPLLAAPGSAAALSRPPRDQT